ncbi:MAG: TIGR04283 family arsenosugar biosynthesis glycosyltransferase [Clostridiales bacterium]|nr:TIGR04283 family arsenosugar biosynthesis glycosyltransferase [Candidatus Crickella equi]
MIVFTRVPVPGQTKTRMMPYFTPEQCADLHRCFLQDVSRQVKKVDADIIVSYTGGNPDQLEQIFGKKVMYIEQIGDGLGNRMADAIRKAHETGYDKIVLIGTDVPELEAETLDAAFAMLDACDVVMGPTEDGGYYLIGMKEAHQQAFNVKKYGEASVLEETLKGISDAGLTAVTIDSYDDIDTPEDAHGYRERMREDAGLRRSATGKFLRDNAKISIIIPTYNEASTVAQLMEQLQEYKEDAEIIFVDGGSQDDTLKIIDDEFRVITCDKGRAIQMNTAARESTGDILFFLHCDSKLPAKVTEEIRHVMATDDYGCFGVKYDSKNFFMWTNRVISNHRAWNRGLPFGDQGIFIDRKLFFEMGMFPEMSMMEDYEFSRKMLRYGFKPGKATSRIETSGRRYRGGTIGILKTEYRLWNLRRMYRRGDAIEKLAELYKDIR